MDSNKAKLINDVLASNMELLIDTLIENVENQDSEGVPFPFSLEDVKQFKEEGLHNQMGEHLKTVNYSPTVE